MEFWLWMLLSFVIGQVSLAAVLKLANASEGCRHQFEEFHDAGLLYRECKACRRLEEFEPDAGGWTAGHWNRLWSD